MATDTTWTEYHCYEDCRMEGCPGHRGELSHNRTVDWYTFNMNGKEHSFEHGELQAMIALLGQLGLFGIEENSYE